VTRVPCEATPDQVLISRLKTLLSTLSADDEHVDPLSGEMANTFSRSSEDEGDGRSGHRFCACDGRAAKGTVPSNRPCQRVPR